MTREALIRGWSERGWVLLGRGATGLLPVLLLAVAARQLGLVAMGSYASALAVGAALAEVADVSSQRHVPRIVAAGDAGGRVKAFLTLRWVILAIGAVPATLAVLASADHELRVGCLFVVAAAVPMVGANAVYAVALTSGRYPLLGIGPSAGLLMAGGSTLALAAVLPGIGFWAPTLGLLAGKGLEWLVATVWSRRLPSGSVPVELLKDEWRSIRYLLFQGLLSAAHARLIIPFVAVLAGAAAAGLLSVGVSLLSIVTLGGLAVTVPAYRAALDDGAPADPLAAFHRVKHDWWLAFTFGVAVTLGLCVVTPWLLPRLFRVPGRLPALTVAIVAGAALFEPLALFAGGLYQASFRDRALFRLGVTNVAAGWLLTAGGALVGGTVGMAVGFFLSRAWAVAALYLPIALRLTDVPGSSMRRHGAAGAWPTPHGSGSTSVLLALVDGIASPGPRVRVLQYIPWLEAAGCRCDVMVMRDEAGTARSLEAERASRARRYRHLARTWMAAQVIQLRLAAAVRRYDRILIYRIPISFWGQLLLRRYRHKILFDFDDALYAAEADDGGPIAALRRRLLRRSLGNALAVAGTVVTSNERNRDYARASSARVVVIPTSVDTERFTSAECRVSPAAPLVIGWIGTPSTSRYLTSLEGVLARQVAVHGVLVRLVGAGQSPFRNLRADVRPWTLETEAAELMGFHIGVMPMPDSPWTRGKAAYKALQYGAACLPTVASWTPTNEELLGTDRGTLLCRTEEDWSEALDRLVLDPRLRLRLGQKGRHEVQARYSLAVNGPRLSELVVHGVEERR